MLSVPLIRIFPEVGIKSPEIRSTSVDFPDPDLPKIQNTYNNFTEREDVSLR